MAWQAAASGAQQREVAKPAGTVRSAPAAATKARPIVLHPRDNVATLIEDGAPGAQAILGYRTLTLTDAVPAGHKLAIAPIAAGSRVVKYGFPIGIATRDIAPGTHVHSHNLATALGGAQAYEWHPQSGLDGDAPEEVANVGGAVEGAGENAATGAASDGATATFEGYLRADGRAGTRNEIWLLPTVGCVARTAARIAERAHARHAGRGVDGVYAFSHPFGCSQLGDDLAATRAMLAALANHPNAGGVLIVGLGCEENQFAQLIEAIPAERRGAIAHVGAQAADDETEAGLAAIDALVAQAGQAKREPLPLSKLAIGVKCGGSDGLSGLTANPLVGRIADAVTAAGGSAVLTEIPEIFGAEQLLMDRAVDRETFEAVVGVVNDFKAYFLDHGEPVSENPSPGNVAGGITTLEEKSLGAVQKGGRAPLVDVRRYGEQLRRSGLTLVEAPGNDAVSSTALAAAGATVILFTTGRGTPLGFPVPTIKIASNSALAARKPGWIDFDAGQVLDTGLDGAADALLETICAVASGRETAAERNGEREIALWKRGVTL